MTSEFVAFWLNMFLFVSLPMFIGFWLGVYFSENPPSPATVTLTVTVLSIALAVLYHFVFFWR